MSKFCPKCFNESRFTGNKVQCNKSCKEKVLYIMRGLPSCGKSYTAKLIAGKDGVVLEVDAYFEKPGEPFRYVHDKREEAHDWIYKRLKKAIKQGVKKIVFDRDSNRPSGFSTKLIKYAIKHGYKIELAEPLTERWIIIKYLLSRRPYSDGLLLEMAKVLEEHNQHRMKQQKIYDRMIAYDYNFTVDEYINHGK